MNIYNYLKKDHIKVSELFESILSTKSMSKRQKLFEEVKEELLLHSKTENATFYAALKEFEETEDLIQHAEKEHVEVEEYLAKLSRLSIDGEKWMEQFGELKHAVSHHIKEEEEEIFEKAKQVLNKEQEKQLALVMDKMKADISLNK